MITCQMSRVPASSTSPHICCLHFLYLCHCCRRWHCCHSAAAANVHVMAFYTQKVLLSLVDCLFALQHHHVSSESRIQGQCHHKIPAQGSSAIRRDDRRPIWANNRLSEQIHQTYEVTQVELDAVENRFWCFQ